MRIVSIILEPKVIKKILDHIRKGDEAQSRAPPSPQTPPAAA